MLPGLVAGHYRVSEVVIDLARLAREAGAVLVLDRAVGLDAARKVVTLEKGGELEYDLLSLNLGSLPETTVPGSAEHALAAKPFETFLEEWEAKRASAKRIAVVGAGAAGVEMAMAVRHRLPQASVTLYSDRPMFAGRLAGRISSALQRCGVELRANTAVEALEPGPVVVAGGVRGPFDLVLWTAGAAPQPWLRGTGLANDTRGFVLVDANLRSVSHPEVSAVGDSATLRDAPHPKSGVYAVRHAAVLLANLRAALEGGPLAAYRPQQRQLALVSCGAKYAIASRGGWSAEGGWVWRWKDWLDRRWVARFR